MDNVCECIGFREWRKKVRKREQGKKERTEFKPGRLGQWQAMLGHLYPKFEAFEGT